MPLPRVKTPATYVEPRQYVELLMFPHGDSPSTTIIYTVEFRYDVRCKARLGFVLSCGDITERWGNHDWYAWTWRHER